MIGAALATEAASTLDVCCTDGSAVSIAPAPCHHNHQYECEPRSSRRFSMQRHGSLDIGDSKPSPARDVTEKPRPMRSTGARSMDRPTHVATQRCVPPWRRSWGILDSVATRSIRVRNRTTELNSRSRPAADSLDDSAKADGISEAISIDGGLVTEPQIPTSSVVFITVVIRQIGEHLNA